MVLTDVVTAGCDTGALLVDGQELDKLWRPADVVVLVVDFVCAICVVEGPLEDVLVGLGSDRVLWWETVDVTDVVIVVVVATAERLIWEWRCFLRGRTSLISHSGSLTSAEMSWCACRVASAGPLGNGNYKTVLVASVELPLEFTIRDFSGPHSKVCSLLSNNWQSDWAVHKKKSIWQKRNKTVPILVLVNERFKMRICKNLIDFLDLRVYFRIFCDSSMRHFPC